MVVKQAEYNIDIYRGDSSIIELRFSDTDNQTGAETPSDLSTITVAAQVRYDADQPEVWLDLQPVIADAANGLVRITIAASKSASTVPTTDSAAPVTGRWDLQFTDKTNPEIKFTPITGSVTVRKDITR